MKKVILFLFVTLTSFSTISGQGEGDYYQRFLEIDGITREYWIYKPQGHDGTQEWPLVFVFHGFNVSLDDQNEISQMYPVADTAKFLIAWPQGLTVHDIIFNITGTGWYIPGLTDADNDDIAFVDAIITDMDDSPDYAIDKSRIHATGFSSGADMAFYLACSFSEKFASVAGVTTQMAYNQTTNYCVPSRPISVLHIQGTEDPYYPLEGDEDFLPLEGTAAFWAANGNCEETPASTSLEDIDTEDNSTVTLLSYEECENDIEVLLYRIEGGGHTWPGGFLPAGYEGLGTVNNDIHAGSEIWNFFKRNPYDFTTKTENISIKNHAEITPSIVDDKISISTDFENYEVKIFNVFGQLEMKFTELFNSQILDSSTLEKGVHFLCAYDSSSRKSGNFKFIKM